MLQFLLMSSFYTFFLFHLVSSFQGGCELAYMVPYSNGPSWFYSLRQLIFVKLMQWAGAVWGGESSCWAGGGEVEEQPEGGHQGAGPSSQQLWQVQRGPGPRGCLQVRSHSHGSYLRRDPLLKNKHILDWSHCVCLLTFVQEWAGELWILLL